MIRCRLERKTRFELATLALARRCSTTELLPRDTRGVSYARTLFLLGESVATSRKTQIMSDSQLVLVVLLAGGAVFLAIFFSIVVASVRESKANEPPSGGSH